MLKLTTFPSGPSVSDLPSKILLPGEHTGGGVGVGGASGAGFGFAFGLAVPARELESVPPTFLASCGSERTAITGRTVCVTHNASKVIRTKVFLIVVLLSFCYVPFQARSAETQSGSLNF